MGVSCIPLQLIFTTKQNEYSAFLQPQTMGGIGLPYLQREGDLIEMNLPATRKTAYTRCENGDFDQVGQFDVAREGQNSWCPK